MIGTANKNRQDNQKVLSGDYFSYVISPQGRGERVYPELLFLGGASQLVNKAAGRLIESSSIFVKEASSKVGTFASKYPQTYETAVSGTVATAFDVYTGEVSPEKIGWNFALGRLLVGKSFSTQLSANVGTGYVISVNENNSDEKVVMDTAKKGTSTVISAGVDAILSKTKIGNVSRPIITNFSGVGTELMIDEAKNKLENK